MSSQNENNKVNVYFSILYILILVIPWLFLYEIFPFYTSNITVTIEIIVYLILCILLGVTLLFINKDLKKLKSNDKITDISRKNMENTKTSITFDKKNKVIIVYYNAIRIFIFLTFCFLILLLILIGISYML